MAQFQTAAQEQGITDLPERLCSQPLHFNKGIFESGDEDLNGSFIPEHAKGLCCLDTVIQVRTLQQCDEKTGTPLFIHGCHMFYWNPFDVKRTGSFRL